MSNNKSFKVGEMIVKLGEVCKIVRIEKRKNATGQTEEILYYKPYFSEYRVKDLVYSIPLANISLASIRKLISKKELESLIESLCKTIEVDLSTDIIEYQEALDSNDPHEIAYALKRIWVEKQNKEVKLSKVKDDLFQTSLNILMEEVAYLKKTTPTEARQIIANSLGN